MKICLIAHLRDLSGANRSLLDLTKVLKKENEVDVIVPAKGNLYNELKKNNINVKVIYSGTWVYMKNERIAKKILKRVLNTFAELRFFVCFMFNKYDIVHYNSSVYGCGAYSLKKLKMKYVWHIREMAEKTFELTFFDKKKSMKHINDANKVIAISNYVKENIKEDIDEQKIVVIHNGITLEGKQEISSKKSNIVLVGAVNRDKGHEDAINAMNIIVNNEGYKDIVLNCIGTIIDNDYHKELEKMIDMYGLKENVFFVGYKEDVNQYRQENEIALLCSRNEAFGRVTIEAMYNKQILIASNTGATKEIVKEGVNGFTYTPEKYDELAKHILSILKMSKDEKDIIKNNAKKRVQELFDIEITARKLIEVYKEVLRE